MMSRALFHMHCIAGRRGALFSDHNGLEVGNDIGHTRFAQVDGVAHVSRAQHGHTATLEENVRLRVASVVELSIKT